jgi:F-type H+-transporting ATPase subunit delta
MAELAVVRRYARALFDTASRGGSVDQVEEELKIVAEMLRDVPRLARVFNAPTIPVEKKKGLLKTAFGQSVGPLTARFLEVVVTRRREEILSQVYAEFGRLANESRNILPVHVTAAVDLTDAEKDALAASLAKRTGKRVVLDVAVDAQILGGMMLRMGDTVIDGSVKSRLDQLRAQLLGAR